MADPLIIVPDGANGGGLTVCDFGMFVDAIEEGRSLDEALSYAGIDSTLGFTPKPEQLLGLIDRVRKYNQTGDIDAFWKLSD